MSLLLAGFAGVALGAFLAAAIILKVYERRADRDMIERRVRACLEYLECLGDLEAAFSASNGDAHVLEQAWSNVERFTRELRVTGWILPPRVRAPLEAVAQALDTERRSRGLNGEVDSGGRAAQFLCEKHRELDVILRREVEAEVREYRRVRFFAVGQGSQEAGREEEGVER